MKGAGAAGASVESRGLTQVWARYEQPGGEEVCLETDRGQRGETGSPVWAGKGV